MSAGILSPACRITTSPGTSSVAERRTRWPSRTTVASAVMARDKGLDGLDRLGFLQVADDGVDHHHSEDDPGIDPFAQGGRHRSGDDQDDDQGLIELGEHPAEGTYAPLRGDGVGSVLGQPRLDLRGGETLAPGRWRARGGSRQLSAGATRWARL